MRPTKKSLNGRYALYLILSHGVISIVDGSTFGAKMPRVSWDFMGNIRLPVPPLEEQQAIATFLDRKTAQIDELIAKKEELLKKLDEKRTALITQAVTKGLDPSVPMKESGVEWIGVIPSHWKQLSIKFALKIPITDGPHETPSLHDEGIPFISAESIKNDEIDFDKKRGNISIEDHLIFSKKYKPKYGDVYIVKSGATTGNVARVKTDDDFNIWSPLAVLRPHELKSTTDYIFYTIKSKPFSHNIIINWSYGTQQNIGMSVISKINIALPPLGEQQTIAEYIKKKNAIIDRQKAQVTEAIERLKEYRTALITDAVTGKMEVQMHEKKESL